MDAAWLGLVTIVVGVGGCIAYYYFSNLFLDKVLFPNRNYSVGESASRRNTISLQVALIPTLLFTILFVAIPFVSTLLAMADGDVLSETLFWDIAARRLIIGIIIGVMTFSLVWLLLGGAQVNAGRNITRANMVRPWLFLAPALIALGLYLAYPVVATLWLSLTDRRQGNAFVGFANYSQMFAEPKFWEAMTNNMLWLIVVPAASTAMGLLIAQLTDRLRWGTVAKSLIFMPMAISLVGASVIFKLVYEARPAGLAQIGIVNHLWLMFGDGFWSVLFLQIVPGLLLAAFAGLMVWFAWLLVRPIREARQGGQKADWIAVRLVLVAGLAWLAFITLRSILGIMGVVLPFGVPGQWLTIPFHNNFFLMVVLIWIQTGFAMVILSAALRGVPEDTVEAAIVDGAGPFKIFFAIKVPQIMGTIVVVWTTITITVLKVFDVVFAMTNGEWGTQVLANFMYNKMFVANDWGVGSAAAMIIMLLVSPILVWNVYNARKEMK